jgi:tRNA dimethylallyltransferase
VNLLCVVGPTASGKTALAAALALRLRGEVVGCDSVQLYKGLDIGSAKPTPEETLGVPHHMLSCACPFFPLSAGEYAQRARACIDGIVSRGALPVVCGGSGLYLRALTRGLAAIPPCPRLPHGPDAYEELQRADPAIAARLAPGDTQRIHRALDVLAATGKPLSAFVAAPDAPAYNAVCVGLAYTRAELAERIARRAEAMLRAGLLDETAALLAAGLPAHTGPLRSVGYRQAAACLRGELPREQLPAAITAATRALAKRQLTWFNHQTAVTWLPPEGAIEQALGIAAGM